MRILPPSAFRAQPWKNGGGITHEIARWPDVDDYDVRISIADDRTAAPFSRFPGYRRWSFLAAAAPIELELAATPGAPPEVRTLRALGDLLEIDGDVAITCRLPDGPTRLFNILVRHGVAAEIGRGPCDAPIRFAFALAAQPWLAAGHAAFFEPAAPVALDELAVWLR